VGTKTVGRFPQANPRPAAPSGTKSAESPLKQNQITVLTLALTLACAALFACFGGAGGKAPAETPKDAQTKAVVASTTAFLKSLSEDQKKKVQFAFKPQKTPTAARFDRGGGGGGGFVHTDCDGVLLVALACEGQPRPRWKVP
jgi:hypothetical protein